VILLALDSLPTGDFCLACETAVTTITTAAKTMKIGYNRFIAITLFDKVL
jgi:hypothetical protein